MSKKLEQLKKQNELLEKELFELKQKQKPNLLLERDNQRKKILDLKVSYCKNLNIIQISNKLSLRDLGHELNDKYLLIWRPIIRFFLFLIVMPLTFGIYPIALGLSSNSRYQKVLLNRPKQLGWNFCTLKDKENYETIFYKKF